jgi:signal transduction histidine kinase
MKPALRTLFKTIFICIFAWVANASAGNVQYKIEEFYDESASLQLEQVESLNFSHTSGEIRKPYRKGNLWLRVSVAANQVNLILYFQNPAIDEVFIYSRKQTIHGPWSADQIPMRALLQGYLLDKQTDNLNDNSEFYLKIRTQAPKQFNVMVLSDTEAQFKQNIKYAVLSSQCTAALILLIWIGIQNWLARSKIFITVMISVPLFVLSRLNYFGLFLNNEHSSTTTYLNVNMVLFLSLISIGTLMIKEGFGRLFNRTQNRFFLIFVLFSLLPATGLLFEIPRGHLVTASVLLNFSMMATLFYFLTSIFLKQKHLFLTYKFHLLVSMTYAIMSIIPGIYFIAPQLFPFTWGLPAFRDFFYPVLAFLIMLQLLNEQKEREMDAIFTLAVSKAAADQEIEKNKQQHVFLGMLLHEIKTPLSVIKFGADSLKNVQADPSKNQVWANRIDTSADTINHILNQCLLADKFEFGLSSYQAEQVDLETEFSQIVERVGYLHPAYPERIHWEFSPNLPDNTQLYVDPVFFRSILENLISNALKYSATNSKIFLTVTQNTSGNEPFFEFQIKNQIGKVGPPQIDHIFSRYYRAEEAKGYSGTGLGLWLANEQAKAMNASIRCEFDNIWTIFTLHIPKLNELQ